MTYDILCQPQFITKKIRDVADKGQNVEMKNRFQNNEA